MKTLTVVAGCVAAATAALLSAGVASAAPDVVGDAYSDAKSMIQQSGSSAVIATRVGSGAEEDDCLVTNAWDAPFVRDGNHANREVMVALNCNGAVAAAGKAGNSAGSPEGRAALATEEGS